MDELPVVDGLLGVLLWRRVGIAQVYGQLPDVNEGVLVGGRGIYGEELYQTVLHKADSWLRAG